MIGQPLHVICLIWGYTGNEMVDAGVAVHGKNGSVYDRFRRRLMLPVIDQREE